ncbi:BACON domain-containing protein [uncultured Alistipes sp.]|uniref:BACON domain-containing protein n=1 Tax=uncultured Alistipes sp. TaxID=538949 RepID=UPI0026203180|nr:BACON domain-containing protein [uncultured Alistipes sp.]
MNFKHMLFRATSALLFMSGIGLAGCNETEPDAFLTVTQQEIEVEYTGLTVEGEMVNFELGTNRSWQATYVEEWIHLTHSEGDRGRVRIFLDIDENNTGKDRTGFIIFEGEGGTRRTIAVTQKLKVDALSVSPTEITVVKSGLLETGEKAEIYLSTNSDWTITVADNSKWITPAATSGEAGDKSIELTVEQNKTGGERTGSFVINAGSKSETVTVIQNLEGLKLSADNFRVNKFGFSDEAQTPLTFTITSAEAWTSTCDDWLSIEPASGEAGETEVTLLVDENTSGAPREGAVKITTSLNGLEAAVRIDQNAKNSLYDDDGEEIGHIYYSENFDWITEYGGNDCVGGHTQSGAKNIYTTGDALQKFNEAGLTDFNPDKRTIYACSDYLKMGAGDKQTGIILPVLTIPEGQATDIELTFVAASNIGGDGTGTPDAVTVTAAILKGPGSIGDQQKESEPMTPGEHWEWTPMSVKIYGITGETQIVIRSTQQGVSGYYRWYLDDIKMTKIAVE